MAGHVITQYMRERGHRVYPLARSEVAFPGTLTLDLRDSKRIEELLEDETYDYVINCAGLLIQASEQSPVDAVRVNAVLPHLLAAALKDTSTRLVHLSTDCVFSGAAGPYRTDEPYDGQRFYDRSKALGEVANDKDLTLRMSIIGPELSRHGSGLYAWFTRQSGTINGFTHAYWNGITTMELARSIAHLISEQVHGIVQLGAPEGVSKFELLSMMRDVFNRPIDVQPSSTVSVDKRLIPTSGVSLEVPSYEDMLVGMRDWVQSHAQWYPHHLQPTM